VNKFRNIKLLSLLLLCPSILGNNLIQQWKNFPKQQLVTRDTPSHTQTVATEPETITYEYEDLVVFSLRATIAAFHFEPKTFAQDQANLAKYFEPNALAQVEQSLYAASGSGLMDTYILQQKPCNAITRAPATIEKKTGHFAQIRLPMILSDKRTIDVVVSLQIGNKLTINDFSIEKSKDPL
jgi:hypothetical protein